jgi:hypothetical protein
VGLLWRLNSISPFVSVAVVSRNVLLEVEVSTMTLMELWKEFAISIKLLRLLRPSIHFISMSLMKRSQLRGLVGE